LLEWVIFTARCLSGHQRTEGLIGVSNDSELTVTNVATYSCIVLRTAVHKRQEKMFIAFLNVYAMVPDVRYLIAEIVHCWTRDPTSGYTY